MNVYQAIDCVENHWNATCPVGQKQAADVLAKRAKELTQALREYIQLKDNEMDISAESYLDSLREMFVSDFIVKQT